MMTLMSKDTKIKGVVLCLSNVISMLQLRGNWSLLIYKDLLRVTAFIQLLADSTDPSLTSFNLANLLFKVLATGPQIL